MRLEGPAGAIDLDEGVSQAQRHIHMHPDDAAYYGVATGDRMDLVVESEQGGVLHGLICRVGRDLKLEAHLDTDEGNAVDLVNARKAYLTR